MTAHPAAPRAGLSLVETLIAIAVLGVIVTSVMGLYARNLQTTRAASERTQATLLLNYFGRRVAGGDGTLLPAANDARSWGYGQLAAAFPDLDAGGDAGDTDRFRAVIANEGPVAFSSASAIQYRVSICFGGADRESCLAAVTVGPAPGSGSAPVIFN